MNMKNTAHITQNYKKTNVLTVKDCILYILTNGVSPKILASF